MNEFTKDELKQLYEGLWRYDDLSPIGEEGKFDSVMLKIQSMLDNYCDHQGYQDSYANPNQVKKCMKCKKWFI